MFARIMHRKNSIFLQPKKTEFRKRWMSNKANMCHCNKIHEFFISNNDQSKGNRYEKVGENAKPKKEKKLKLDKHKWNGISLWLWEDANSCSRYYVFALNVYWIDCHCRWPMLIVVFIFFSISSNWINTVTVAVAVAVAGDADRGLAYQHIIWFRISVRRVSYDVFYYYHFATQFQVPNKRHLLLLLLSLCKHCEIHFKRMPHCVCVRSPLNDCWGDGGVGRSEP